MNRRVPRVLRLVGYFVLIVLVSTTLDRLHLTSNDRWLVVVVLLLALLLVREFVQAWTQKP